MRENRLSGSMRGGEVPEELTTAVCLTLIGETPAYSTEDPIALLALPGWSVYLILFIHLILSKIRGGETG